MKFDNKNLPDLSLRGPANYNLRREAWLISYAAASAQIAEALSSLLISKAIPESSLQYNGMVNAIYIVYGRPFHRCNGIGQLEKSDIPTALHDMHSHLMTFRDKIIGHKDAQSVQLDADYTANEVRAVVSKNGKMHLLCTDLNIRLPMIINVHKHVAALQSHFSQRQRTLISELLPNGNLPDGGVLDPGEFILSVDWRDSAPFKRVPDASAYTRENI